MKFISLYLLLTLGVLFVTGCGEEKPDPAARDAAEVVEDARRSAPPAAEPQDESTTVLVLGNSLAAGYGLGEEQSFPALLQDRIDSLGWDVRVINAGLSGETTAGGLRRIEWLLRRPVDVLILELGGNDGLRGIPPDVTRENLAGIIDRARAHNPDMRILLAGMQIPPNLGQDYTRRFREIYPALAEEKEVELIPFLLEGVGGVSHLMQADGIHPTAEGQRLVAENVWEILAPVLQEVRQPA